MTAVRPSVASLQYELAEALVRHQRSQCEHTLNGVLSVATKIGIFNLRGCKITGSEGAEAGFAAAISALEKYQAEYERDSIEKGSH